MCGVINKQINAYLHGGHFLILLHCSKFNVFCGDMGFVIVFGNYAKIYMLYYKAYTVYLAYMLSPTKTFEIRKFWDNLIKLLQTHIV